MLSECTMEHPLQKTSGTEEIQMIKWLPNKHKDQSLNPQNFVKKASQAVATYVLIPREAETADLGSKQTSLTARLVKSEFI